MAVAADSTAEVVHLAGVVFVEVEAGSAEVAEGNARAGKRRNRS